MFTMTMNHVIFRQRGIMTTPACLFTSLPGLSLSSAETTLRLIDDRRENSRAYFAEPLDEGGEPCGQNGSEEDTGDRNA